MRGIGSSSISSPTSRIWCTSEGVPAAPGDPAVVAAARERALGYLRLAHPFPSLLDALLSFGLALVAGAPGSTAALLGLGMLALQVSIGAINDLRDAPGDRLVKPDKPIPAGLVQPEQALLAATLAAAVGLVLSALIGPGTLIVGVLGLATGLAYDLRLKGTALSWLPFAAGVPLLVLYAWVGVRTCLPPVLALLLVLAAVAGASLALTNALADLERDRASGVTSVASWLGSTAAWRLSAGLAGAGLVVVAMSLAHLGPGPGPAPGLQSLPIPSAVAALAGGMGVLAGLALAAGGGPGRRQLGWEVEALGFATLALGWLSALLGAGAMVC